MQVSADERKPIGAELEQELTSRPLPNLTQRRIGTTSSWLCLSELQGLRDTVPLEVFFVVCLTEASEAVALCTLCQSANVRRLAGVARGGGSVRFTYG